VAFRSTGSGSSQGWMSLAVVLAMTQLMVAMVSTRLMVMKAMTPLIEEGVFLLLDAEAHDLFRHGGGRQIWGDGNITPRRLANFDALDEE